VREPFNIPLLNRHNYCPNSDLGDYVQNREGPSNKVQKELFKKRKTNKLIDIDPRMDYFDAVGMIHEHIMSLDI
jgi:hypothetical protein